jgi:ABC-type phosphate transport system substrate-binding protein
MIKWMRWILYLVAFRTLPFGVIGRPMKSGTWEGFINYIAGTATFRACKPRETWWLKGKRYSGIGDEIKRKHDELTESPYDKIYARLKGKINKTKGQYGPLGTYHRVFYVSEILEIRERRPEDCK